MAGFITIDASARSKFNYGNFLKSYFKPTGDATQNGSSTWLDGEITTGTMMGSPFSGYISGDQYTVKFNATENNRQILVEGEDMGYDLLGTHTYYGSAHTIHFGYYTDATTYSEDAEAGVRGPLEGLKEGLIVSGLEIAAEKGLATNEFYDLYNYLRHANSTFDTYIDALYDIFGSKAQHLIGSKGSDIYTGTRFADIIEGGKGDDVLDGGKGKDVITGGKGVDTLTGGKGADTFVFVNGDSKAAKGKADTITDFKLGQGDRIDLSGFDANTGKNGVQDFDFIGTDAFSKTAGELRYEVVGRETFLYADTNGDGKADFAVHFDGKINFTEDAFLF